MTDGADSIYVLLARLEGKLDAFLARQDRMDSAQQDHEQRLRALEAVPCEPTKMEERIRALELRPHLSPARLWTSLLSAVVAVPAILAVVDWIRGGF